MMHTLHSEFRFPGLMHDQTLRMGRDCCQECYLLPGR
jgi:hypothetical protein